MGQEVCCNCRENYRESEVFIDNNSKALNLMRYSNCTYPQRTTSSKNNHKLLDLINNQLDYGSNPQVKTLEATYGVFVPKVPFPDTLPTIIVNSLVQENSAIYYGQWYKENQEKHGFGILVWPDGSKYVGYWVHDKANIVGRLMHSDGDMYEGEWKNDMANGQGKLVNSMGVKYCGGWVNDMQHGKGIEEWKDGTIYEGEYIQGNKSGQGRFTWADGASYEGQFKDNAIEGEGTYTWSDGKQYTGTWKNSRIEGKGVLKNADGTIYKGNFVKDKEEGYGICIW